MIPVDKRPGLSAALWGTFGRNEAVGDIVYRASFAPPGHDTEYLLDLMSEYPPESDEHRAAVMILEALCS